MDGQERQAVILVVDDDGAVRRLTRRLLEQDGYAVLDAAHGPLALSTWRTCRDAVNLAIVDVSADGAAEIIDVIQGERPSTPILAMSTFPDGTAAEVSFLRKPFGAEGLHHAVAGAIRWPHTSS